MENGESCQSEQQLPNKVLKLPIRVIKLPIREDTKNTHQTKLNKEKTIFFLLKILIRKKVIGRGNHYGKTKMENGLLFGGKMILEISLAITQRTKNYGKKLNGGKVIVFKRKNREEITKKEELSEELTGIKQIKNNSKNPDKTEEIKELNGENMG